MTMRLRIDRRDLLLGAASLGLLPGAGRASDIALGPARSVSFDDVVESARAAAAQAFVPAAVPAPDLIEKVDYSAHWQIRFRDDASLLPAGPDAPVQLFHPGRYFPQPVAIFLRDGNGTARQVPFDIDAAFTMPPDSPARDLPPGFGYAGFRVMRPGMAADWVSFLGASYFRTDGPDRQYGLSARGIAVNTGLNRPEEFPRFSSFWIGPPERAGEDLSVWARLDGPSLTGAYDFGLTRGAEGEAHTTRVSARLFARAPIERLGIAPLTSMFWYSERDRTDGADWRPEIHDSDGLAIETGAGERIWRPLGNPPVVSTASFFDDNPRGFGLIQRDRAFENYQDDGVFYHKRPSAWVRPLGDWGKGAVQLVEIPTEDETFDNIVAYWVPEAPVLPGREISFDYEIEWRERDPVPQAAGHVVATRLGQGGTPGNPIPEGVRKVVIDFAGGSLAQYESGSGVEPVIEVRGGSLREPNGAFRVLETDMWRVAFDLAIDGTGPASLRVHLRDGDTALTETWIADIWPDDA